MDYREFQKNFEMLSAMLTKHPHIEDPKISALFEYYIRQNVIILNEMISVSISNLKTLQHAKTPAEIIAVQTQFSQDLHKTLTRSLQRFLHISLDQIADYNEQLKHPYDLATD